MLRDYQQRAIFHLYNWFEKNPSGNPCLILPTGSGKSHIIAALCKEALQNYPETQILMLTHVKELIEQNAEKVKLHWEQAPLGIYSAGIGKKELGFPITFAGIQSVRNKAQKIGHIDLVIIDEAHLVSHKDEGGYRKLLNELQAINPYIRVIGLTATPYRLGHGLITDKPALFDDLIEPTSIEELVAKGYLSTLRSKLTHTQLSTEGVHKRGGEFIESELQEAVNKPEQNLQIIREIVQLAEDRKHWLFFCTGVAHAQDMAEMLNGLGIKAACIIGETPKTEREQILEDFKAGRIKALTNANVLTTGFDAPNIDLIAMLRPTMSPGLYVQMAGRGMRLKEHTDHCLVLDFAGVVSIHGPITNINLPDKNNGKGEGEAPIKVCDNCHEIVAISTKVCPACLTPFPEPETKKLKLHNDDIMGLKPIEMEVSSWNWNKHISKASGKEMLRVSYYGSLSDPPITEYLAITHEGFAGNKARNMLMDMAYQANVKILEGSIEELAQEMNVGKPPSLLEYRKSGKYNEVVKRIWDES